MMEPKHNAGGKLTTTGTSFGVLPIAFEGVQTVKEGVTAEIYTFDGDSSRYLAIVPVAGGTKRRCNESSKARQPSKATAAAKEL